MSIKPEDHKTLIELLENKQMKQLKDILLNENEFDIAEFMEELDAEKAIVVFRLLSKSTASNVFAELSTDVQMHIISRINDNDIKTIIEDLYVDDMVDMIEELPANVVKRILKIATPETRNIVNQFLRYEEGSAGSIMTAEYVALKKYMTVKEAFDYIRATGLDKETVYTCYVTNKHRKLQGVITLKDLLMANYEVTVGEIMDTNIISTTTSDEQENVALTFKKYDLLALPVVDHEDRIVGIITADDVFDVMEEETTEDIEKMAAITPSEKPYLKTGVLETWGQRTPWLLLLMISAAFTGHIITMYESALGKFVILTSFIPMLMSTGGNSGSQSSVTVTRGLSLGEIEFCDLFKVLWKEIRVSVLCGLTLSVANFAKLMLFDRVSAEIAIVVCLTLLLTVLTAKCIGCSLPMFAKKLGFDPAVMASPFITTIVDAVALMVYFNIAVTVLKI